VRFLPPTEVAVFAPNYQQTMMAISFGWFGTKANKVHYEKAMNLLIKLGMQRFHAKVHFGKYFPIKEDETNKEVIKQLKENYKAAREQTKLLIHEMDPKHTFQNQFTKSWFDLSSSQYWIDTLNVHKHAILWNSLFLTKGELIITK
jgi:hypothetical protein